VHWMGLFLFSDQNITCYPQQTFVFHFQLKETYIAGGRVFKYQEWACCKWPGQGRRMAQSQLAGPSRPQGTSKIYEVRAYLGHFFCWERLPCSIFCLVNAAFQFKLQLKAGIFPLAYYTS
jgi:hypothetical protein